MLPYRREKEKMSMNLFQVGQFDERNAEYEKVYTPKNFFSSIVTSATPVIFDVGAHKGE